MDVHGSVEIAAAPERVWPFLVEPEKVKRWYVTLEDFQYIDDRRGPGARIHIVEHAGGPTLRVDFEATQWAENRLLALHMVSGSGVKSYDQRLQLVDTPAGCRFTFDEHVELPYGPIGRLLGVAAKGTSERHVAEMLAKLKELAEA